MHDSDRMQADKTKSAAVFLQLGLGMIAFGSATPISKIVTAAMPVFVGAAIRMALAILVLAPFFGYRLNEVRRISRRDWLIVGLIAVFGMFGFSVLMLYGMKLVSGVAGAIVMSTAPAVTATGAVLFQGETATWRKVSAVTLAVVGILILQLGQTTAEDQTGNLVLGVALVFGAVCCEAAYTLLGRAIAGRVDPVLAAVLAAAIALVLFLPFAIWQLRGFDLSDVPANAWLAIAWYGAGTLALGTWLWYSGIAKTEGSVAAGFMGLMPASALVLSYLLLDEDFQWVHILGFGTVFSGVLLISWEHARMSGNKK